MEDYNTVLYLFNLPAFLSLWSSLIHLSKHFPCCTLISWKTTFSLHLCSTSLLKGLWLNVCWMNGGMNGNSKRLPVPALFWALYRYELNKSSSSPIRLSVTIFHIIETKNLKLRFPKLPKVTFCSRQGSKQATQTRMHALNYHAVCSG